MDTRGRGGYVLIEPSLIDGKPYRASEEAPADTPQWLTEKLIHAHEDRKPSQVDELDTSLAIKRAQKFLKDRAPAVEGQGGDQWTYETIAEVKDRGISETKALEILGPWNDRCAPPWELDHLEVKIENVYKYGQNEPGSKAVRDTRQDFAHLVPKLSDPHSFKYQQFSYSDFAKWEEPAWIVPGWIAQHSSCMIFGKSGTYKSFAALDLALAVATGEKVWGIDGIRPGMTLYLAGEGAIGLARKRVPAWFLSRGINDPEKQPFRLIRAIPPANDPEEIKQFIEEASAQEADPEIVIIDTLHRMTPGLDENSARDMGLFLEAEKAIREAFGCTVVVVHHAGKDESRGERGSSALRAGFDTLIHVSANHDINTLTLDCRPPRGKQKDSDPPPPIHLKGMTVQDSLVFEPMAARDHAALTTSSDDVSAGLVAKVLTDLGAIGVGKSVETNVIATEVLRHQNALPSDEMDQLNATATMNKKLRRLANGGHFRGMACQSTQGKKPWLWFLPESENL
jgi:hypothetical protein